MQEDRFWLLISLRLSGEATAEELAELEGLLQLHPEMGLKLEVLYQLWETQHSDPEPGISERRDRHWQRLSLRTYRRPWLTVTIAAASLFIEEGFSPKRVQDLMGHSTIQITFDRYGHLFPAPADDQVAMRRLQARLIG